MEGTDDIETAVDVAVAVFGNMVEMIHNKALDIDDADAAAHGYCVRYCYYDYYSSSCCSSGLEEDTTWNKNLGYWFRILELMALTTQH